VHFVVNVLNIGTWNVRSLYRTGSFQAAARELARYKLNLVCVCVCVCVCAGGWAGHRGHGKSRGL